MRARGKPGIGKANFIRLAYAFYKAFFIQGWRYVMDFAAWHLDCQKIYTTFAPYNNPKNTDTS